MSDEHDPDCLTDGQWTWLAPLMPGAARASAACARTTDCSWMRFFSKLRHLRRVATRCDRFLRNVMGVVTLGASHLLLV